MPRGFWGSTGESLLQVFVRSRLSAQRAGSAMHSGPALLVMAIGVLSPHWSGEETEA